MGTTIPKDMGITIDLGGPFRLAAVAFALVGRHDCLLDLCRWRIISYVYSSFFFSFLSFSSTSSTFGSKKKGLQVIWKDGRRERERERIIRIK